MASPLKAPECPECDKVREAQPQSQTIGEFVEWLAAEKGIQLAKTHRHTSACYTLGLSPEKFREEQKNLADSSELKAGRYECSQCGFTNGEMHHPGQNIESLLADFFGIDLNKRAAEQDAVLAFMRAEAAQRDADAAAQVFADTKAAAQ